MIELSLFYLLSFTCCLLSVHVVYQSVPCTVRYSLFYFFVRNNIISYISSVQNWKSFAYNTPKCHKRLFLMSTSTICPQKNSVTNNNERHMLHDKCTCTQTTSHVLLRTLTKIFFNNQFLTDFHLCNLQLWTRDKHGQHPHNPRDLNCRLHDDDDCINHTGSMILWLIQLVIRKMWQGQSVATCQTS